MSDNAMTDEAKQIARGLSEDDFGDYQCGNCGGEGVVYGCSWDWQCDTWDEAMQSCDCCRKCDWCA